MGAGQTVVAPPLPGQFGLVVSAGTVLERPILAGGQPWRRVELSDVAAPIVSALLSGVTVAEAARATGCSVGTAGQIARRLIQLGMAAPRPPVATAAPVGDHVAAVIPAHNAAATIAAAVTACDGIPVLVVDDGSTDGTGAIAEAAGATVVRNERPTGPAAARNVGMTRVGADIVVLLDSDAEPASGWLGALLPHLEDEGAGGVAPRIVAATDESLLGRFEAECGVLDRGPAPGIVRPDGALTFVSTTALVVRRDLWCELGGFVEDLRFGEDLDFVWRAAARGRPIVYEPRATVVHHHRSSLRAHLQNRSRYGSAAGPLSRRHEAHPRSGTAPPVLTVAAIAAVLGHPKAAAALTAVSAARLTQQIADVGQPPVRALATSTRSTIRSSRSLAAAIVVPWLPVSLILAAVGNRTSRLAVLGAVAARHTLGALRRPSGRSRAVSTPVWALLRLAEDMALSIGTLHGCLQARTARSLAPGPLPGPNRATTVLGVEVTLP